MNSVTIIGPTPRAPYGLDLISQTASSTTHYYGYDGQGSVRMLLDENTAITDTYDFDAYGILLQREVRQNGVLVVQDDPSLPTGTPNHYLYTGEQWDSDLGMYFLRARYYNPKIGRFWTMDTYEGNRQYPQSLHKYLYCDANPVNMVDPSGHFVSSSEVLVSTSLGTAGTVFFTHQVVAPLYYRAKVNSLKTELKTIQEQTELFECDKFVEEAADLMKRKGKREMIDWWIIYYKSAAWLPEWRGEIWAENGFGRYGGQRVSGSGIHYGIVVRFMGEMINDFVADNNVILVSKWAWTCGYMVYEPPFPPRSFITVRQAADKGLGEIKEISYSDFKNMR